MIIEEEFTARNSGVVVISVDESDYRTTVKDSQTGERIGYFEFDHIDEFRGNALKLTWAHLEGMGRRYVRQGIGRRILQIVSKMSDLPISANEHDGHRRDDGSHLTTDGPKFVGKMRDEGLITRSLEPEDDD